MPYLTMLRGMLCLSSKAMLGTCFRLVPVSQPILQIILFKCLFKEVVINHEIVVPAKAGTRRRWFDA